MIESVNKQLFRQFTECVRGTLEGQASSLAYVQASTGTAERPANAAPSVVAQSATVAQPVHILPLLWRTFLDWLRRITTVSRA
jgi:hypothetical protein